MAPCTAHYESAIAIITNAHDGQIPKIDSDATDVSWCMGVWLGAII